MPRTRQIYTLNPKDLAPETIAVTFAKTSRSPQSFREIADDLTEEKSREFHERWVVGYGHASVAEHAVLHIAFENVSRLAVETIEGCRLASFTEKSTRYQKWGAQDFYIPDELANSPLEEKYISTCKLLFDTYLNCLEQVESWLFLNAPEKTCEEPVARKRRLRTEAIDACRFLLPASSLANVGMTVNARELEHAIVKMLSHPLSEVRQIGEEMKQVAQIEVPTLVKYALPSSYLQHLSERIPTSPSSSSKKDWCILQSYDSLAEIKLAAAALFKYREVDYETALRQADSMDASSRETLTKQLLSGIESYELPLREAEHISFTFELVMDQGAYYEFKRHRMMTLSPQPLGAALGYCIPRLITSAGMQEEYCKAMHAARQTWMEIAKSNQEVAAYVVPNGYNRRVLTTINLRSLLHLVRLRTRASAHFSIRRVANRMADCVSKVLPGIGKTIPVAENETWQSIQVEHFSQVE
ncbi:MAG: FAD-dependent thymidylate synthase [Anaerolineaceae bacterium]